MQETPPKAPKLLKLTKKRKGFAKDYVLNGENGQEAAKANFNVTNDNSARAVASELLTFPNVIAEVEIQRETLKSALEKKGVTPDKIALKVNELLDNEDPNAIDKGLKHATNIYGVEDASEKPKSNSTYNFIFNAETQADVRAIEEKIKARLMTKHEFTQEN